MSKPKFVYKLVHFSSPPPDPLPQSLPLSELDQTSGFIHLSTSAQVAGTLKHFFGEDPRVYVLRIPYDMIEKDIKWEDAKAEVCGERGGEGLFPHLYNGGRLGCDEIESMEMWVKMGNGWDEALEGAKAWLEY